MTILSKQEHRRKLSNKGRTVVIVGYDLNRKTYRVYDPETGLIHSFGGVTFEETMFPLKLDKLGGGGLSSTPPSVRPGSNGFELNFPLTSTDEQGPIVPVARTPPASPVVAAQRTPPASPAPSSRTSVTVESPSRFQELDVQEGEESDDPLASPPRQAPVERRAPSAPRRAERYLHRDMPASQTRQTCPRTSTPSSKLKRSSTTARSRLTLSRRSRTRPMACSTKRSSRSRRRSTIAR